MFVGTTIHYGVADQDDLYIQRASACDITIDNVILLPWPDQNIGSINELPLSSMTSFTATEVSSLDWASGALDAATNLTELTLDALNWSQSEVDDLADSLAVNAAARPTTDCTVDITGLVAPSASGKSVLNGIVSTYGWTISYTS